MKKMNLSCLLLLVFIIFSFIPVLAEDIKLNLLESDNDLCKAVYIRWQIGPGNDTPYLDACQVKLDLKDIEDDMYLNRFEGENEHLDVDENGISDSGFETYIPNDYIQWFNKDRCERIYQQDCGDNSKLETRCAFGMLRLLPRPGIDKGSFDVKAEITYKLPNGVTQIKNLNIQHSFSNCNQKEDIKEQ